MEGVREWFESRGPPSSRQSAAIVIDIVPTLDVKLVADFKFAFGFSIGAIGVALVVGYPVLFEDRVSASAVRNRRRLRVRLLELLRHRATDTGFQATSQTLAARPRANRNSRQRLADVTAVVMRMKRAMMRSLRRGERCAA